MAETLGVPHFRDMHAKFESLFNAGDLDGLMRLYQPDAVLHPQPGAPVQGTAAIRAALEAFLAIGGKVAVTTTATFEGPNGIALTQADWAIHGGSMPLGGKTAEVLRRQPDGNWLYIIDNPWA